MIEGWSVVALALGYVSSLFALAWYADRAGRFGKAADGRPLIYALSLAVYCTSWTFFGSVGLAAVRAAPPLQMLISPPDPLFTTAFPMPPSAVLSGPRHIDATEHQEGLIVAVAAESLVKLAAFLAVGFFVMFSVFGGIGEFI